MRGKPESTALRKEATGHFDFGDDINAGGEGAEAVGAFVLGAEEEEVFEGFVELGFEF